MLIEFMGPPGAGKSTLTPLVVGEWRRRGIPVNRVHMTGYEDLFGAPLSTRAMQVDRFLSLVAHPRLSYCVARCLVREGRGLALSWMVNLARRDRGSRRASRLGGVTVLEEGPLSAVCLAGCAMSSSWSPDMVLQEIKLPSVAVSLHLDPAEANRRVIERAGRFSDQEPKDLFQLAERYAEFAERVETLIAPHTSVLRITTDGREPREVAESITSQVPMEST